MTGNQPPPLAGYNLFEQDAALVEALRREGGGPWEEQIAAFGELLGGEPLEWGRLANEHPPRLRTHDRYGERLDEIEFHPAWDSLLRLGLEARVQSLPWVDERPGAHVARATLFMLLGQVEAGVGCPLSMTFAAVPALRTQPDLAAEWIPRLTGGDALCGMAMTERQGGSDVRANETTARPAGDGWELDGHKWFCSAPMSDAFLVLAQAPAGTLVLPARAAAARLPDRAAEGQARQPLERVGRDRARRCRRPARRRGGTRPADDPRDGQPHAARLRSRLDRADAPRGRRGDAPRRPPLGVRPPPRRAAADAERPRRPLRRVGGGDRDGAAARARLRRGGRAVPPHRHRGREVLDLQADAAARGRGARVPRRQRLRRGVAAAAPLPREPAQLDLGGLRQRQRARRPAGARPGAGDGGGVPGGGAPRGGRDARLDAAIGTPRARARRAGGAGRPPAARAARGDAAGLAARPPRRARGR